MADNFDYAEYTVEYSYAGETIRTIVVLSPNFPTKGHLPEILARKHGTTVDRISSVQVIE